jgi:hypothetical protein
MIHGHSLTKEAHVLTSAMCLNPLVCWLNFISVERKIHPSTSFLHICSFFDSHVVMEQKRVTILAIFCYFMPFQGIARVRAS